VPADYLLRIADHVDALLSPDEHSRAVGRWVRPLLAALGQPETVLRQAELAGRLHDIGTITVPEGVLAKTGELTDDEWLLVHTHPIGGARLLRALSGYSGVAEIIAQHHERCDGTGYPAGLTGRQIRIEARAVAVCDAWAAMRARRRYRPALPETAALEQLQRGRGSQFDSLMVDAFLDLRARSMIGDLRLGRLAIPRSRVGDGECEDERASAPT
jgi:HD-GYP domain-containing protein (c-di-GMP phosphodiesterase class II)